MNDEFLVPCPVCGTFERTQYVQHHQTGVVDIMCWDNCGMDFQVNGLWFMLNRVKQESDER